MKLNRTFTLRTLLITLVALGAIAAPVFGQTLGSTNPNLIFPDPNNPTNPYAPQFFTLFASNAANVPFTFTVNTSSGGNWLSAQPTQNTTSSPIQVSVNTSGLTSGFYSGTITFSAAGYASVTENVSLSVGSGGGTGGAFTLSQTAVPLTYVIGGSSPSQPVTFSSVNQLTYTANAFTTSGGNWLLVTPNSGGPTTNSTLFITTQAVGLSPGTYFGTVQVTAGGTTQNINVTLTVSTTGGGTGAFSLSTTSVPLSFNTGGTAPSQLVTFSASSPLSFTASATTTSGGNWLFVQPSSSGATTSSSLFITTSPAGLSTGTYFGTIQVTAGGSTQTINVTLTVNSGGGGSGTFTLSSTQLNFNSTGGSFPSSQSVSIFSSSGSALGFSAFASSQGNWLSVNPNTGTTPSNLTVSANPSGLSTGTYNGTIQVAAGGQTQTINVTLSVGTTGGGSGTVSFIPNTGINFTYQTGTQTPSAQTVSIATSQSINYTIQPTTSSGGNWLGVTPQSGFLSGGSQLLTISVAPTALSAGTYSGQIQAFANGQLAGSLPITLTVTGGGGTGGLVSVNPSVLTFNVPTGSSAFQQQQITLNTTTSNSYSISATSTGNWLFVQPNQGSTNPTAAITVFANPSGLGNGSYPGTLTISVPGQPQVFVNVTMVVGGGGGSVNNLQVTPATLSFSYVPNGNVPGNQLLEISTPTSTTFQVTANGIANNVNWLSAGPVSGQTQVIVSGQPARATIAAGVFPQGLPVGNYTGTITVSAAGLTPVTVTVNLGVGTTPGGSSNLNPSQLSFTHQVGSTLPPARLVTVSTPNGQPVSFTTSAVTSSGGSWLNATPLTGNGPGSVAVTVNPTILSPGTYSGTVNVAISGSTQSSLPVTLTVSSSPVLRTNIAAANFNYQIGGSVPAGQGQSVEVSATGGGQLPFSVTPQVISPAGGNWLSVSQTSGTTPSTIGINISATGLSAGTYTGTVSFTASGQSPIVVPVSLTVSNLPLLNADPRQITFTAAVGATAPQQSFALSSTGTVVGFTASPVVSTTASWLSATANSSQTPATITVGTNPVNLADGTYSGAVIVSSSAVGNSPLIVPVLYVVGSGGGGGGTGSGAITVSPAQLTFTQIQGGGTSPAQSVTIGSNGAFNYSVSTTTQTGVNWLQVTPSGGQTPATIQVSTTGAGLGLGSYAGSVIITAPGSTNSPQIIPVTMNVVTTPTVTATPTSLAFSSAIAGTSPAPQTISLQSIGSNINFSATSSVSSGGVNWIEVTPNSGSTPASITVRPNVSGLSPGNYSGTVTINVGLPNPITIPVSLNYLTTATTGTRILPQFAFGGGWSSALYFANTSDQAVTVQVQFVGDSGAPLFIPALGATSRTLNLTPRGSAIIEAPNTGALTQGYVSVVMPDSVTGYGVFRQVVEGRGEQEAVVPFSSATATRSTLIFDDSGFTTSVAVVNPGTSSGSIAIVARDSFGTQIGTSSVALPAGGKTAFVLRNAPGLASLANQRGTVEFTATSGNIAVLGLRFGGQAFTSIPTTDR